MQVKPTRRLDIATRITQPSFVRGSGIMLQPSNLEMLDHYGVLTQGEAQKHNR